MPAVVHCTRLQSLRLPSAAQLPDTALQPLQQLPCLVQLAVSRFTSNEASITAFAMLTGLSSLHIASERCTGNTANDDEAVLRALLTFTRLSQLKIDMYVSLMGLSRLTALTYLKFESRTLNDEDCVILARLPLLGTLICNTIDLMYVNVPDETRLVTITRLEARSAGKGGGHIRNISRCLYWFPNLHRMYFRSILDNDVSLIGPASRLMHLGLASASGAALPHLSPLMNLISLRVDNPRDPFCDDKFFSMMCKGGTRQLRRLSLSGCNQLTDASLSTLIRSLVRLNELSFRDCKGFTSTGVLNVLIEARELRNMRIGDGCAIDALHVLAFRRQLAMLEKDTEIVYPWRG